MVAARCCREDQILESDGFTGPLVSDMIHLVRSFQPFRLKSNEDTLGLDGSSWWSKISPKTVQIQTRDLAPDGIKCLHWTSPERRTPLVSIASATLPKLCTVREFAQHFGLSEHQGYEAIPQLPDTCVVRLGRRIRINLDNLAAWINSGGAL